MSESYPLTIFRRRFLIKRDLQVHFAAACFLLIFLSTACVWFLMHMIFKSYLSEYITPPVPVALFLTKANFAVWFFIAGGSIGSFLLSIFFSHYVAGPIYRIERTFRMMLEEEQVPPIRFRKNDPLHDTADLFNEVINEWNRMKKKTSRGKKDET